MPYSTKQAVSTASCGGKAGLSVWGGGGQARRARRMAGGDHQARSKHGACTNPTSGAAPLTTYHKLKVVGR